MIPKPRLIALSKGARPETPDEERLMKIVETFDYFGFHRASRFEKLIMLEDGKKLMVDGLLYPVFNITVEMAQWQEPAPAPVRKSFLSFFRKAA